MRKGDWIGTYTGIHFYPLDPKPEEVSIDDIAHSLSLICRFNGHSKEFYSVAQHSLNVAKVLKKWRLSELTQLYGLLHDAAEVYIGDITRPFKLCLSDIGRLRAFNNIEIAVTKAINQHFGIPCPTDEIIGLIKRADDYILTLEAKRFMRNTSEWRLNLTNESDRIDTFDGEAGLIEACYKAQVLELLSRTSEYREYLNGIFDPRD